MPALRLPWVDGEKIPDEKVRLIFQNPPGVFPAFPRSALVIGSRGVGKTTLLRYLKETHTGLAFHVPLAATFSSLTKQTGLGPLAQDVPAGLGRLIAAKATTLLALDLSERLTRKGIPPPVDSLMQCLPRDQRVKSRQLKRSWLLDAFKTAGARELDAFDSVSHTIALREFTTGVGLKLQEQEGPLLLLLDRADMVPAPALSPVVELLDQSPHYTALVATRPGHAEHVISGASAPAEPGDHYAVVHLGTTPYSQEWSDFVLNAVQAQLGGQAVKALGTERCEHLVALCRDSLRATLEVFARVNASSSHPSNDVEAALLDVKENQLSASQKILQPLHTDYRRVIAEVRRRLAIPAGPVQITIDETKSRDLFEQSSKVDRFVSAALRAGALCMPNGQRWSPGLRPRELEIPPLLVWEKGDAQWAPTNYSAQRVPCSGSDLFRGAGGPTARPTIFVAFRMGFQSSQRFRTRLEELLAVHPTLNQILITDGKVPDGSRWADEIRERIRKAKLIVADVTGVRTEVTFEAGIGFGLRKSIVPVSEEAFSAGAFPRWLGATQVGTYATETGLVGIVSSTASHLTSPPMSLRPAAAVPGVACWLGRADLQSTARGEFEAAARAEGLHYEYIEHDDNDDTVLKRSTRASLLVISMNGSHDDALSHFVAGAIVARPTAGYGAHSLPRRILILLPAGRNAEELVSDALRRCADVARVIEPSAIRQELKLYGKTYDSWVRARP